MSVSDSENLNMSNDDVDNTDLDFEWYERLCCSLEDVQHEFEKVAIAGCGLFHAMFQSDDKIEQNAWDAFIAANSGRVENAGWEEWEPMPDGWQCGCYHGRNEWLAHFHRIASSGYLILRDIQFYSAEGRPVPDGFRLKLPPFGGHLAWLQILYDTASLNTALLRSEVTCWDLDDGRSSVDLTEEEIWCSTKDGTCIPAHPLFFRLHLNLFRSSAEAISYWFNPNEAVSVGGVFDTSPICLPRQSEEADFEEVGIDSSDGEASSAEIIIAAESGSDSNKPKWDGRQLWVNGKRIKRYTNPAEHQKLILDAFEAIGWSDEIDDPFQIGEIKKRLEKDGLSPEKTDQSAWKDKRRQAVAELNKCQNHIRFRSVRNGYDVSWEWRTPSDESQPESSGE
jgi:hypothetical protein